MSITEFIENCQNIQPQSQEDIKRFFEGVVFFPYDQELVLQSYLFLNIRDIFPSCTELLLFEKAPNGKNTDKGKCDFVYLTSEGSLFLVETKFINTLATGETERTRRTNHRKKVIDQVIFLRDQFSKNENVPVAKIQCGVFTTDAELIWRGDALGVLTKSIDISKLEQWVKSKKHQLFINNS